MNFLGKLTYESPGRKSSGNESDVLTNIIVISAGSGAAADPQQTDDVNRKLR